MQVASVAQAATEAQVLFPLVFTYSFAQLYALIFFLRLQSLSSSSKALQDACIQSLHIIISMSQAPLRIPTRGASSSSFLRSPTIILRQSTALCQLVLVLPCSFSYSPPLYQFIQFAPNTFCDTLVPLLNYYKLPAPTIVCRYILIVERG